MNEEINDYADQSALLDTSRRTPVIPGWLWFLLGAGTATLIWFGVN